MTVLFDVKQGRIDNIQLPKANLAERVRTVRVLKYPLGTEEYRRLRRRFPYHFCVTVYPSWRHTHCAPRHTNVIDTCRYLTGYCTEIPYDVFQHTAPKCTL